MRLKTKIEIIGLMVIALVVVGGVGIYYCIVGKKFAFPPVKEAPLKESASKEGKVSNQLPKKIEPKLVWEKEFDSEIINFVVPRMPGIRRESEFPIVSVETEKEVIFFNNKGNISGRISIEETPIIYETPIIHVSENGEYVLVSIGEGEFEWDIRSWKYISSNGKELWKIDNVYGCPDISPDGNTVVMCRPDNGIWFYDKNGRVIKSYDNIRFAAGSNLSAFSVDGNYYALSFVYSKPNGESECNLILFEKNGEILWKQKFDDPIEKLWLSDHSEVVLIKCGWKDKYKSPYFYLFDKMGNLLWQKSYDNPQEIILSPKGDILLIESKESSFSLIDTLSGKEFNSLEFKDTAWITSISPNSVFLCIWIKKKEDRKYRMCIIPTKERKEIFKKDYSKSMTTRFCSDNKCYIINGETKKLLVYELAF